MPTPKNADRAALHNATLDAAGLHAGGGGGGVTDHGALTGLSDDDHPQYATDTDLTTHAATPHGGGSLTVEEVDGSPTSSAVTKLVFPNDSVAIASGIATIRQVPTGFIGAAIYNSSDLATSSGTEVMLTMNSELYDTDGFHDTSTNSQRFTVPAGLGGKYLVGVANRFDNSGGGYVAGRKNGGAIVVLAASSAYVASSFSNMNHTAVAQLAAGDYVEFKAFSSSGGNIKTSGAEAWAFIVKLDSGKVGGGIGARATNTAATSLANNTPTAMPLATEDFDTDGFHDNSTNNSRMTIPAGLGGKYLVVGQYTLGAAVTANSIYAIIRKNGATDTAFSRGGNNTVSSEGIGVTSILDLVAGDYVELIVNQNKGSAQTLEATAGYNWLSIMRLDSSANNAYPPGYEYDYATKTTDTTVSATTEATANTVVTGNAVTYDGVTSVIVEFFTPGMDLQSTTTAASVILSLYDGSSSIGLIGIQSVGLSVTNDMRVPVQLTRRITPTAGAHTYSVRAHKTGTTTASVMGGGGGAAAWAPAFIRITKV